MFILQVNHVRYTRRQLPGRCLNGATRVDGKILSEFPVKANGGASNKVHPIGPVRPLPSYPKTTCCPSSQSLLRGVSISPRPYYAPFQRLQLLGRPSPQSLNPTIRNSRSIAGYRSFRLPACHTPFIIILLQNPDEPQKSPELQSYTINLNECGPMVCPLPLFYHVGLWHTSYPPDS